jgi:hypothetical protein
VDDPGGLDSAEDPRSPGGHGRHGWGWSKLKGHCHRV